MSAAEKDPKSVPTPMEQKAAEVKQAVKVDVNAPTEVDFKKKMQENLNAAKKRVEALQKEIAAKTAYEKLPESQKEAKNIDLFGNVVKLFEVIRLSREHENFKVKFQELGIPDKAGQLLYKIQGKLPPIISPSSIYYFSLFIVEITKSTPKRDKIKQEWDKLQKYIPTDITLLRAIRDSLVAGVRDGDIEGFKDEQEAQAVFVIDKDNSTPLQGGSGSGLTPEERSEFKRIENSLENYIKNVLRDPSERAIANSMIREQDIDSLYERYPGGFESYQDAQTLVALKARGSVGNIMLLKTYLLNFGLSGKEVDFITPDFIYKNIDQVADVKDGVAEFSIDLKEQMQNSVFRVVTAVFARATENLNERFQLSGREQNVLTYVQEAVTRLMGDPTIRRNLIEKDPQKEQGHLYRDFRRFMQELIIFIDEEKKRRTEAHNLVYKLVNGTVTTATMKETAAEMNISNVNSILSGYQGSIVDIATHLIPQYIQHRTAIKNKNEYAADLWAMKRNDLGEQFFPDFDGIRKALRGSILEIAYDMAKNPGASERQRKEFMDAAFKDGKMENGHDTDALNAAVERAMAMGIMLSFSSQRAPVEAALVKAPGGFLPTPFYDNFNSKLQYGFLKGHETKKQEDWILDYVPELRSEAFRIRTNNEFGKSIWERVSNGEAKDPINALRKHKGWVPEKIYKSVDTTKRMSAKALVDRLKMELPDPDFATYDDEISLREAYGDMTNYDVFSVGGGRIGGMKLWVDGEMDKAGKNKGDWEEKYKFIRENVGAGSLWMWDADRAGAEVKPLVIKKFQEMKKAGNPKVKKISIPYKEKYSEAEQNVIYDQFRLEHADGGSVEIHEGKTAKQLIERRLQYLRGKNFLSLLERSPENFLYTMARLEPELAQTVSTKKGGLLTAYDFYFNEEKHSLLEGEELVKKGAQRNLWKARWTDSKEYLGDKNDKKFNNYYNFDRLKEVAYFWHRYYMQTMEADVTMKEKKLNTVFVGRAQDKFFERMTAATRRVMIKNKGVMTKEDIIRQDDSDDREGRTLSELLFNQQNGFVSGMQRLEEKFGDAESGGEKKFFYWMANRWFNHDFRGGVIPTQNDIKMSAMTARATEKWSEALFLNAYERTISWNESAVKAIADIDAVLIKAATEKNISGIVQLHEKVHNLRGMLGVDVSKLHYMIATAVIRFYQRDFRLRAPWPFNWVWYDFAKYFGKDSIDKDMSLSTRYGSYGALQFTEENIREYGTYLAKRKFLKPYGSWSRDMLWKSLGADREKYATLQAGPSIFMMAASITFKTMLQTALTKHAGDFLGDKKT